MSEQDGPGLPTDRFTSDLWMASHLDILRRQYESKMKQILLAVADLVDTADRLMADPSFAELPPAWQDGLRGFRKRLSQTLLDAGAQPVATVGELVDPRVHDVDSVVDQPGRPGTILRELMPGYVWQGKTLRPASVVTIASHEGVSEAQGPLQPPTT